MSYKAAGIAASAVLALFATVAVVLRRARTEHPPAAASVPRIEDL
ncbi:hypothetical protein [Gordonia sp. (in: high G+C Gram-positive bacteria)]|nr:hypothetical protein [Gordonia sp. (in: high G+C Gram-positive bacteria)]